MADPVASHEARLENEEVIQALIYLDFCKGSPGPLIGDHEILSGFSMLRALVVSTAVGSVGSVKSPRPLPQLSSPSSRDSGCHRPVIQLFRSYTSSW